ncbi:MAG TPA: hypothetical protein VLA05_11570 [Coriobacteriia bacterium]|nr:hypothetical protein [Coriobacteriia bacterium]
MAKGKSGWVTFSWIIFLLVGLVNTLYGVAGLGRKEYFPDSAISATLESHAWVWLILGIVQILVAVAIAKRVQAGLFAGLTLAVIAALVWFFYMLFLPTSGFALVVLYLLVIYGLAAHTEEFALED